MSDTIEIAKKVAEQEGFELVVPARQGRRHLFADEKGRKSIGMAVNGSVYFVGDLRFGSRLGRRRVPFRRELRFHAGLTPLR